MSIELIIQKLEESRDPHKGIFWFVKDDEEDDFHIIYLDVPEDPNFIGNSKNGLTYTHEKTWNDLVSRESSYIKSQKWNYFPRGRVEIRNDKANIYLNPNLLDDTYKKDIIDAFNLKMIPYKFIPDGSSHYKCYLDER